MTRRRPLLIAAFVVALAATAFFTVQSFRHARNFPPPPEAGAPVAGWMTPGYIGHGWDLPRDVVAEVLGVDPKSGIGRQSLDAIARERGVPVETLIAEFEAAIAARRAERR